MLTEPVGQSAAGERRRAKVTAQQTDPGENGRRHGRGAASEAARQGGAPLAAALARSSVRGAQSARCPPIMSASGTRAASAAGWDTWYIQSGPSPKSQELRGFEPGQPKQPGEPGLCGQPLRGSAATHHSNRRRAGRGSAPALHPSRGSARPNGRRCQPRRAPPAPAGCWRHAPAPSREGAECAPRPHR